MVKLIVEKPMFISKPVFKRWLSIKYGYIYGIRKLRGTDMYEVEVKK
jgi:hypothetical protein